MNNPPGSNTTLQIFHCYKFHLHHKSLQLINFLIQFSLLKSMKEKNSFCVSLYFLGPFLPNNSACLRNFLNLEPQFIILPVAGWVFIFKLNILQPYQQLHTPNLLVFKILNISLSIVVNEETYDLHLKLLMRDEVQHGRYRLLPPYHGVPPFALFSSAEE